MPDAVSDHSVVFINAGYKIVLEQTFGKIGRRVWNRLERKSTKWNAWNL